MTDFYPMGTAAPQQEPLTVNQGYNTNYMPGPGSNVTYTTPSNCIIGAIVTVFFIVGTSLFIFMIALAISNGDGKFVLISLFPLVFSIVATVLGSKFNLCASITVDHYLQTVVIQSKRMCFCFSKTNIIQIGEIQQVIVQIDHTTSYNINGVYYNAFEIIFKLVNGREVRGCSGVINKNNEGARAASILRNGLPSNIPFGGELCY